MSEKQNLGLPIFSDPMVAEANVCDASLHVILSDGLLRHQLRYVNRQVEPRSLYGRHLRLVGRLFSDVKHARALPDIWKWEDLVTPADNIGTVEEAAVYAKRMLYAGRRTAYITGGLEFTQGQLHAMRHLINRGYHVIMGHEPYVYAAGKEKRSSAITDSVVPLSFWSKVLGACGFLFTVPRPLPEGEKEVDAFYDGLYEQVTARRIPIVVSESDPFKAAKRRRGPIVEIPFFPYPSTTDLWNSVVPAAYR